MYRRQPRRPPPSLPLYPNRYPDRYPDRAPPGYYAPYDPKCSARQNTLLAIPLQKIVELRVTERPKVDVKIPSSVPAEPPRAKRRIVPPLAELSNPKNTSPASQISTEVLEIIFTELKRLTIDARLPNMPVEFRDPRDKSDTYARITPGEAVAYKKAMIKKQLFDLGRVCKGWWHGAGEVMKDEAIIIGERDVKRVMQNYEKHLPLSTRRPFKLTVSSSLPSLILFFRGLSAYECPIPLTRLTILHSFAPETLGPFTKEDLVDALKNVKPEELYIEWYSGEKILTTSSLDQVASLLKKPWEAIAESDRAMKEAQALTDARAEASTRGLTKKQIRRAHRAAVAARAKAAAQDVVPPPAPSSPDSAETLCERDVRASTAIANGPPPACIAAGPNTTLVDAPSEDICHDDLEYLFQDPNEDVLSVDDETNQVDREIEDTTVDLTVEQQMALYARKQAAAREVTNSWTAVNAVASAITNDILVMWRHTLVKFDIRANWLDMHKPIRISAIHGALKGFDYHYVPLPGKIARPYYNSERTIETPVPPLGCLKSLDNILMWDFRSRPQKWKRKIERSNAAKFGEEWIEPEAMPAIDWTVHVPYDLWMQEKDRVRFKGSGRHNSFGGHNTDVLAALGRFLLAESKAWSKPVGMESEHWTERETFEKAMSFAIERQRAMPLEKPKIKGHLLSITRGKYLDGRWIAQHIDRCQQQAAHDRLELLRREEQAMNDPDPEARQAEFNAMYVRQWLILQGDRGRRQILEKLRKKHGARTLWTNVNWPIFHPNFKGVQLVVEKKMA